MTPFIAALRRQIDISGFSVSTFAGWVLGRDQATVHRWLSGVAPSKGIAQYILRMKSVTVEGDDIVIRMRRGPIGPRFHVNNKPREHVKR